VTTAQKRSQSNLAWLVFGPDRGLVAERARALCLDVVADLDDVFAVTSLTDDDLKADPACLADAMAALSMMGGERLVRIKISGEAGGAPIAGFLKDFDAGLLPAEARLVVEAGELKKAGRLRKAFEASANAKLVACYPDSLGDLGTMVETSLQEEGLTLSPGARARLLPTLEGDRARARSEIEKLILYKGLANTRADGDATEVTEDDVLACTVGSADAEMDSIIDAALSGQTALVDDIYHRALSAGRSPIGVLRALQRRLDQIAESQSGGGVQGAQRLGAPRFGPAASSFSRQCNLWRGAALESARDAAFNIERAMKHSGAPIDALGGDLLLKLALRAERLGG
jgi:DNA polymerase III subunit delta